MTEVPDEILNLFDAAAFSPSGLDLRDGLAAVVPVVEAAACAKVAEEIEAFIAELPVITFATGIPERAQGYRDGLTRAVQIIRGFRSAPTAPVQPASETFQPHIGDPDARALYERLRLALTCVIADDTEADIREAVARALTGGNTEEPKP